MRYEKTFFEIDATQLAQFQNFEYASTFLNLRKNSIADVVGSRFSSHAYTLCHALAWKSHHLP